MADSPDLGLALRFLSKLKKNNNKPWFDANKEEYQEALAQFEQLVGRLIEGLGSLEDLDGLSPKDCIMRIYRDVRFSKDKSPYKTSMTASIGPGGRKSRGYPYYLHIAPGNHSMLAGGCHEASTEQLARWRSAVDKDASTVKKLISRKDFVAAFGGLSGDKLAKAPKGYAADHPELELLRLKQITVMHTVMDKELLSPSPVPSCVAVFKIMKPFLDYLGSILPGAT